MLEKLRAFADMGRTQGVTTSGTILLCGALTSTAALQWYHIIYFTILIGFSHMALNVHIALGDTVLDSNTYVPSRNPVTEGTLTLKEAQNFVYITTLISLLMIFALYFFLDFKYFLLTLACFPPSYLSLVWYGSGGKRYLLSYDYSFSVSYSFTVLFGAFAIGGLPTYYTWVFIGIVIFAPTAFAQWENGFKDVDADRSVGVRSLAAVSGIRNNRKIPVSHPYFLYGVTLKVFFVLFCFLAYLDFRNIYFLAFLLIYGIPSQVYIMYRFATKELAIDHRRTILLDVTLAAILGFTALVGNIGVWWLLFLVVYLIGGYLVGSAMQSNCEFKFGRFAKPDPDV